MLLSNLIKMCTVVLVCVYFVLEFVTQGSWINGFIFFIKFGSFSAILENPGCTEDRKCSQGSEQGNHRTHLVSHLSGIIILCYLVSRIFVHIVSYSSVGSSGKVNPDSILLFPGQSQMLLLFVF
jgi:hypothetical protein